jgi:hypothetical protein
MICCFWVLLRRYDSGTNIDEAFFVPEPKVRIFRRDDLMGAQKLGENGAKQRQLA